MVWGEQRGYLKRRTATSKTFPYCCSHRSLTCTGNLDINKSAYDGVTRRNSNRACTNSMHATRMRSNMQPTMPIFHSHTQNTQYDYKLTGSPRPRAAPPPRGKRRPLLPHSRTHQQPCNPPPVGLRCGLRHPQISMRERSEGSHADSEGKEVDGESTTFYSPNEMFTRTTLWHGRVMLALVLKAVDIAAATICVPAAVLSAGFSPGSPRYTSSRVDGF